MIEFSLAPIVLLPFGGLPVWDGGKIMEINEKSSMKCDAVFKTPITAKNVTMCSICNEQM